MKADPILDTERLKDVAEYLRIRNERDYVLFWTAIYTGLRIQDILELRVRDVKDENGKINIIIRKTRREKNIEINKKLKKILEDYTKGKHGYEFLFKSRTGQNKALSRQQAFNIISEAGKAFNMRISPHSLRKTFGRQLFELSGQDITVPMEALGHTTPSQTRRYIGITEAVVNSYIQKLDLS